MSEIEIAEEVIEEAKSGFEESSSEEFSDWTEEEIEEFESEISEARSNVEALGNDARDFKQMAQEYVAEPAKKFAKFVVKNVAIGAILYGVNLGLAKIVNSGGDKDKESNKRKQQVVKNITKLIQTETDDCKKLKEWMDKHKDDTITLDGIEIPLESIFFKYMDPISDAVDQAFKAAQPLQQKLDGKVSWNVPTADVVSKLLDATEAFITAFDNFHKFAAEKADDIPQLKSLPVSQADVDNLKSQLEDVKKMPFY